MEQSTGFSDENADIVRLIGAIYDAVVDKTRWWHALDQIRSHFGFQLAGLTVIGLPHGNVVVQVVVNIPDDFAARVADYGNDVIDLWGGPARLAALPLEEPILNSHVTSRA